MILHGFFRSSAAWRVRIALALKGIDATSNAHNLRLNEQRSAGYLVHNPQGLVPALQTGDATLVQSLAIIEYLDETHPEPPLLPADAVGRAQVRAMAQIVACDIHPINNLRVQEVLRRDFGADDAAIGSWIRHWVEAGFGPLETLAAQGDGRHCHGASVTIADICLVPQIYNARRFGTDLAPYPTLRAIDAHLATVPAFADTVPERQPDAG